MQDGVLYRNLVIQPNKNAENPTLKAKANANSHQALVKLKIPINSPPLHYETPWFGYSGG